MVVLPARLKERLRPPGMADAVRRVLRLCKKGALSVIRRPVLSRLTAGEGIGRIYVDTWHGRQTFHDPSAARMGKRKTAAHRRFVLQKPVVVQTAERFRMPGRKQKLRSEKPFFPKVQIRMFHREHFPCRYAVRGSRRKSTSVYRKPVVKARCPAACIQVDCHMI